MKFSARWRERHLITFLLFSFISSAVEPHLSIHKWEERKALPEKRQTCKPTSTGLRQHHYEIWVYLHDGERERGCNGRMMDPSIQGTMAAVVVYEGGLVETSKGGALHLRFLSLWTYTTRSSELWIIKNHWNEQARGLGEWKDGRDSQIQPPKQHHGLL